MVPRISTDDKGRKVYTLKIEQVQKFALIFMVPVILIFGLPFYLIWGTNVFTELKFRSFLFLILFIAGGIVIHELLHGITWAMFAKRGFRSVKFGILWEYFTPYCHCMEPLKVWQFIVGALAPLFLMGLVPSVWAMISGNSLLMFFGIFYIWGASGDIIMVWILRRFRMDLKIYDHPDTLGFIVDAP